MTATDELRAMLDERDVRWDYGPSGASSTAFWVNGKELSFSNWRDGLVCSTIFTPAQAIAATLGVESDTGEYERDENQHLRKLVAEMFQEHKRIYNNNTWGLPHSYPHASSKQMASWYSECMRWGIEVYSS